MQTINNLLTKWRLWINRDHTFQADELKELQSHLMEEINYLVNREGLSEEEAFHKAVSLVGEREGLDQEYVKTRNYFSLVNHFIHIHLWKIIPLMIVIFSFVISDFMFCMNHYEDNIEIVTNNGYPIYALPEDLKDSNHSSFSFRVNNEMVDWEEFTINDQINPIGVSSIAIGGIDFFMILDSQYNLWFNKTKKFTSNSVKMEFEAPRPFSVYTKLKTKFNNNDYSYSKIAIDQKGTKIDLQNNKDGYWGLNKKDNLKIFSLKETRKKIIFNAELVQLFSKFEHEYEVNFSGKLIPIHIYPPEHVESDIYLIWNELRVIRKPIHLIPFLYNQMRNSIVKNNQVQKNENPLEAEDAVS